MNSIIVANLIQAVASPELPELGHRAVRAQVSCDLSVELGTHGDLFFPLITQAGPVVHTRRITSAQSVADYDAQENIVVFHNGLYAPEKICF
jgi:hypothetical protein